MTLMNQGQGTLLKSASIILIKASTKKGTCKQTNIVKATKKNPKQKQNAETLMIREHKKATALH